VVFYILGNLMSESTPVLHKWYIDNKGDVTFELVFDEYRVGMVFCAEEKSGWWMASKRNGNLFLESDVIPPDMIKQLEKLYLTRNKTN
jgi:hypothetical protein